MLTLPLGGVDTPVCEHLYGAVLTHHHRDASAPLRALWRSGCAGLALSPPHRPAHAATLVDHGHGHGHRYDMGMDVDMEHLWK